MAQQLKRIPRYVNNLMEALRAKMPGSDFDVERVGRTNRYRVAVVWDGFTRRSRLTRQERVWQIAMEALPPDELLKISMILALRPEEVEQLGAGA